MGRPKKKGRQKSKPLRREIPLDELKAIVERARTSPLGDEEVGKLIAAVETLAVLTQALESKDASIRRLRQMIFGSSTEKTSSVVGDASGADAAAGDGSSRAAKGGGDGASGAGGGTEPKEKRKGHGRNGAAKYTGAEQVKVPHETLRHGDRCPACERGKVYVQVEPAVLVRVVGMAPLAATVYELERLRCNLCGEVFTARAPEGVGNEKYDESAAGMIGLLKYGCGLPFNRLERLERGLGIPLPAATQWEVVERGAGLLAPAYGEIVRQAAQGEVLHNDDTTMKILALMVKPAEGDPPDEEPSARTGIFTSGIVSVGGGRRIALFFTGRKHAGENLGDVLAQRARELSAPIQMCDALSRNTSGDFETILASCLAHARRRFVDVSDSFPDEVRHVLEALREVYHNDEIARERELSPEDRLRFHQANSGHLMTDLETWLREQVEEKKVEPNSGLGEAIAYMRTHWPKLTLFLLEPGAPLDNNICERVLKIAILHRKNAMFYKTENGARVGDLYMTLIHTTELHGENPFDYLVELQRHHEEVARSPADWMPWTYRETLARLGAAPSR